MTPTTRCLGCGLEYKTREEVLAYCPACEERAQELTRRGWKRDDRRVFPRWTDPQTGQAMDFHFAWQTESVRVIQGMEHQP